MLKFTQPYQGLHPAQVELRQRVKDLDEWQARFVLSLINNLFGTKDPTADEMEVAA